MKIKLPNCDFMKEAKKRIKYSDEYLKIIEEADELVKINMRDNIDSLNAANAITTIRYEINRQRSS